MLNGKSVVVVVPAYNEETQIGAVITSMPEFVDRIIVINDCSTDNTEKVVLKLIHSEKRSPKKIENRKIKTPNNVFDRADEVVEEIEKGEEQYFIKTKVILKKESRIILINHLKNGGKGAGIKTGFKWCRDNNIDCTVTMDGDGQMDPRELLALCTPVIENKVDYVKANRLRHRSAFFVIPKIRYFGNSVLSLLTKIASGYWRLSDTQTGYTAISLKALNSIRIHKIYDYYGYPNDLLVKLNIAFCTVTEVDSKPVYNIGEKSKMKEFRVMPKIAWLLFKSFWIRLYVKYLFRDFHPIFLFYHFAFFVLLANIPFAIQVIKAAPLGVAVPLAVQIAFIFLSIIGFQSLFFAMWMDMTDNERLQS